MDEDAKGVAAMLLEMNAGVFRFDLDVGANQSLLAMCCREEYAANTFALQATYRSPGWEFPGDPFVQFSGADEQRAARMGWSIWGGKPVERVVNVSIPNAVVVGVTENSVRFQAVPQIEAM